VDYAVAHVTTIESSTRRLSSPAVDPFITDGRGPVDGYSLQQFQKVVHAFSRSIRDLRFVPGEDLDEVFGTGRLTDSAGLYENLR
jgi:hypothetical protein